MTAIAEYRRVKAAEATAFEQALAAALRREGRVVIVHETLEAQLAYGDLRVDGIDVEVKLNTEIDRYHALYIEVDERTRDGSRFVPSGIFARATWRWSAMGDYVELYVIPRSKLVAASKTHRHTVSRQGGGGHGFLLTVEECVRLAVSRRCLDPDLVMRRVGASL